MSFFALPNTKKIFWRKFVTRLFWGTIDFHRRRKNTMEVNGAPELLCFPHSSEYLPLCSEQTHSYRFGTTWGWVNDDNFWVNCPFKRKNHSKASVSEPWEYKAAQTETKHKSCLAYNWNHEARAKQSRRTEVCISRWSLQAAQRRAPQTWSVWRWPSGPGSGSLCRRTGGTGPGCMRPSRSAPERSPPPPRLHQPAPRRSPDRPPPAGATGAWDSLLWWLGSWRNNTFYLTAKSFLLKPVHKAAQTHLY